MLIALIGWPSSAILWYRMTDLPMRIRSIAAIGACFAAAAAMSLALCIGGMRSGVRALNDMGK